MDQLILEEAKKIFTVIVCFKPNITNLSLLCQTLLNNNSAVIIIDNTEECYININSDFAQCSLFHLGENTGIAHAQNIGIKHAIKCGANVIVFFDQDSKIDSNFLPSLLPNLVPGEPKIVAPVIYDNITGIEFPSFRLNKLKLPVKIYKEERDMPYDVDFVISSGSAVTTAAFNKAGLMDEDFFIDYVDIEWCIRCRNKNIPIQIVPGAIMIHSIGEKIINFWFLSSFIHSPIRCYYQIRNSFILFKKENIPFLMALKEVMSMFIHKVILLFFVKKKFNYLKFYSLAVLHGFCGIVGKKPVRNYLD